MQSDIKWTLFDTVLVSWQQLSAWYHVQETDTRLQRVDFAYGYWESGPEYYYSCDLDLCQEGKTPQKIIAQHKKLMKKYLRHRRRWSCPCPLAQHCISKSSPEYLKTVRGPTNELDDLGLKHFLCHPKVKCYTKRVGLVRALWYVLVVETQQMIAAQHNSDCRCNCFGERERQWEIRE